MTDRLLTKQEQANKPLCLNCRQPYGEHLVGESGAAVCPPQIRYYTPCPHARTQGSGMISSDGKSSGSSYCLDCGENFTW